MKRPSVLMYAVAVILLAALAFGCRDRTGGPAAEGVVSQPGETQQVGDTAVTVHSYRLSNGGAVVRPAAGNVWIIVDVSMKNIGDNNYALSAALQTSLRDGEGRNYKQTAFVDTTTRFNGSVGVEQVLRGEVGFEVPEGLTDLIFIFQQRFQTGQAHWAIE